MKAPSPSHPHLESWEEQESRRTGVPIEKMYAQWKAKHYADTHSGRRNAPRHYRHRYGSKVVRRENKRLLYVCGKYDEWDKHSAHPFKGNAGWYWF